MILCWNVMHTVFHHFSNNLSNWCLTFYKFRSYVLIKIMDSQWCMARLTSNLRLPSQPKSTAAVTVHFLVCISHPAEDRRLSWLHTKTVYPWLSAVSILTGFDIKYFVDVTNAIAECQTGTVIWLFVVNAIQLCQTMQKLIFYTRWSWTFLAHIITRISDPSRQCIMPSFG